MRDGQRVYVDLDDVLGETARMFLRILDAQWGRTVDFEELTTFDLGVTLEMERDELMRFMDVAHHPDHLAEIAPMPRARDTLAGWAADGVTISVVTGRPPYTLDPSLAWLEANAITHHDFHFVDKYSRYYRGAHGDAENALGLADLGGLGFTFAVEDFLDTAVFLASELEIPVALFDRPWNRDLSGVPAAARARLHRCRDWTDVARRFTS